MAKKKRLFCEISPTTYAISLQKEILKRHIKNMLGKERFAKTIQSDRLPVVVSAQSNNIIKCGPGIDMKLQENKADNIRIACGKINGLVVLPGESFSFWRQVGKTSRKNGFAEGRVLVNGKLVAGLGGGLCNLANTINLLVLHSPLTITELHHHSDALAPDPNGIRIPYSAGTSVNYNFLDYRFRNDTSQPVQLCTWCEDDDLRLRRRSDETMSDGLPPRTAVLHAELRTTVEYPNTYRLVEEDHHFRKEENGKYYRVSKIYRETISRATGEVVNRELSWKNHSEVMFDESLIPPALIRDM